MSVTDQQVATLRAHLAGDFGEYQRLWPQLDRDAAKTGYTALVAAAFFEAVDRRFAKTGTGADVIEFVGAVRARFDQSGDDVDPRAAEILIRAVLGEDEDADLDDDTVAGTQIVLLTALILDEDLDDVGLDEFMAEARKVAEEWTS